MNTETKKTAQNTAQQGDVVLKRIPCLPPGTPRTISQGRMILAEGEATGHSHCIEEKDSQLLEVGNTIVLDLKNIAVIEHQEHGPITLAPGLWEVGRVQEFDYLTQMKKQVVD